MSEVLCLRHSHEAWQALEVSFSYWSKTHKLHLKDELQLMQQDLNPLLSSLNSSRDFVIDWLSSIILLMTQIKFIGILWALGPDYKIFFTTIISQLPLPFFSEIVPKAFSHEIFSKSVSHSQSTSIYYTQQTSHKAELQRVKPRFSTTSAYFSSVKSSSNILVYYQPCDKEGHLAKHCLRFLKFKKKQLKLFNMHCPRPQ